MIYALFKREFAGYFRSPVAYVVSVAFLLLAAGLGFFVMRFFDTNTASLEPFFTLYPWLFLFLGPAVGMRLWAEERRSGSLELLLTLPVTPLQAVLGKFLAGWLFFAVTILLTFPLALTVGYLGNPDWGVVFACYFGSVLMSGAYLAIAGLMSSLTKNQVIAFVAGFFACLALVLVGFSVLSDMLNGWNWPVWLIDAIANFGFIPHFDSISRGLIDVRSVIYFASIMAFSLFLTVVALERGTVKSGQKSVSTVLLAVALILVNYLASAVGTRFDLTAEKVYTLSAGTKSLLHKIEEPVTLRFYFSRSLKNVPVRFKNYGLRVEELLRQYAHTSGKVKLEVIDPKPDSKEEETATRAGLTGQPVGDGTSMYFGLIAQQADQEKVIESFSMQRESLLEFDVSQLLYSVQQLSKPKLGLLTALPLRGSRGMPGMRQSQQSQYIAEEWGRTYDLVDVQPSATELPAGLDALAVVHPQGLPEKMLFAIDQFVLSGKPVFIAVDPNSRIMRNQSQQMSMFGGQQPNTASDLPRLLSSWGVNYDAQNLVGDRELASTVQTQEGPTSFPAWLTLRSGNLNHQFVPASDVKTMILIESGSFSFTKTDGIEVTPVLETSTQSGTLNAFMLQLGPNADFGRMLKPDGTKRTLAALLRGTFKTAFPDGEPKEAPKPDDKKDAAAEKPPAAKTPALKVSAKPGTVFLIADTDWMFDDFSFDPRYRRMGVYVPINDNATFGSNTIDFLGGSTDLISIRGKGTSQRPLEVFRKMEVAAQAKYREQLEALEARLSDVQKRLSDLLKNQKDSTVLVATPAVQAEIDKFRNEEVQMRSQRRAIRQALREDIESLQNRLIVLNLLAVPLGMIGFGVWFFTQRNRRQRAA